MCCLIWRPYFPSYNMTRNDKEKCITPPVMKQNIHPCFATRSKIATRKVVVDCWHQPRMKNLPLKGRSSMPSPHWIPAVQGFPPCTSPCRRPACCRRNKPEHHNGHQVSSHFNTLLKKILWAEKSPIKFDTMTSFSWLVLKFREKLGKNCIGKLVLKRQVHCFKGKVSKILLSYMWVGGGQES